MKRLAFCLTIGAAACAAIPEAARFVGAEISLPAFESWYMPALGVALVMAALGGAAYAVVMATRLRGPAWRVWLAAPMIVAAAMLLGFASFEWALAIGYDRYSSILTNATVYASNFDDSKFRVLEIGMPLSEAQRQLGEPLRRFDSSGQVVLTYSDIGHYRTRSEKGYHQRWLVFQNDRLVKVFRRYITTEQDPLS